MIYLIDYENVSIHGFEGHTTLSPEDEVIVFLTPNHKKIDTEFLTNSLARFRFVGIIPNGHKNFMDFQIVALCSKYIYENENVAIVSNDAGYLAVQDFFRNCVLVNNKDIKLISNLRGDPVEIPIPPTTKKKSTSKPAEKVEKSDIKNSDSTIKTSTKPKKESLDQVMQRLPLSDSQKDALYKTIKKQNDKKEKLTQKKFIKKLDFLPSAIRATVIAAILPYVKMK